LLPDTGENDEQFKHFYKIGMPVFNNYFDTGELNFEEQEIERIEKIFTPYNKFIKTQTQLEVKDFISLYSLIDEALYNKLNTPLQIMRNSVEASAFDKQKHKGIHPSNWKYTGINKEIISLVKHFNTRSSKFTFEKSEFKKI